MSHTRSFWLLQGGLVALGASIFTVKELVGTYGQNTMEIVNIGSLTAWILTTTILFSFTGARKATEQVGNINETPEDVKASLRQRLQSLDYEGIIGEIKIAKRDDIMTYVQMRPEYRLVVMLASLLMLAAVIIGMRSIVTVEFSLLVLSLGLVTPLTASLVYN